MQYTLIHSDGRIDVYACSKCGNDLFWDNVKGCPKCGEPVHRDALEYYHPSGMRYDAATGHIGEEER